MDGVYGTARLGGGAPVIIRDGELDEEVQRVEGSPWVGLAASRAFGNGEEKAAGGGRPRVEDDARLHESERGKGQEMRQSEWSLQRPKTGGGVTWLRRNRRRS